MYNVDEGLYLPSHAPLSWFQTHWSGDLSSYDLRVFIRAMINSGYSYREIFGMMPQSLKTHVLYVDEIHRYYRYCVEQIAYDVAHKMYMHISEPGGYDYHRNQM